MAEVGKNLLMPETVFFSSAELAEIIGIDFESVNNWIRRGIINRTPIGQRPLRNRLFSKEEVYKAALKGELVNLGIPPSPASDAVNSLWNDWDGTEPPDKQNLYAVVTPKNGKFAVAFCTQTKSGGPLYKYKASASKGSKSLVEMDFPEQAFAVLPLSAVLEKTNSRLSELLLGTTSGRFSRG
jgi:hypothetical protein